EARATPALRGSEEGWHVMPPRWIECADQLRVTARAPAFERMVLRFHAAQARSERTSGKLRDSSPPSCRTRGDHARRATRSCSPPRAAHAPARSGTPAAQVELTHQRAHAAPSADILLLA